MNQSITSDAPSEIGFALGKASQKAKETGNLIWLYSDGNLFYMSDEYPDKPLEVVGKCYPGGRIELKRKL